MSKEAQAPSTKGEVKISEVAVPVVEKSQQVTTKPAASELTEQVANSATVKKIATNVKVEKKVVAAKPAKKEVAEKPSSTSALKTPAKSVKKAPLAAKEKVTEAPKVEKAPKVKKAKLVRDSFTIPETDYTLFATIKQRALSAGIEVKKSEILRAGLVGLANLDDAELVKAIGLVERIKTGRPKK